MIGALEVPPTAFLSRAVKAPDPTFEASCGYNMIMYCVNASTAVQNGVDKVLGMARRPLSKEERALNVAVGARIAELRKARGLTQVELAEALGIVQAVVSTYEVGRIRPHPGVLVRLADVLDVSVDEILGRSARRQPKMHDHRLWNRFLLLERLPERDQKAVMRMISSLAAANGVKEAAARR